MFTDLWAILEHLVRFAVAYALALPLGIEREKREGSAAPGVRTFPLVAGASCGFVLIARSAFPDDPGAQARVLYGLMTGIGFIGGGAILKNGGSVRGTSTAAALWATGAIGGAVGFGIDHLAVAMSVVAALTLYFGPRVKSELDG